MKLKDVQHGRIVKTEGGAIGMIVGITNNLPHARQSERAQEERAIVLVQWSWGANTGIHPANIEYL